MTLFSLEELDAAGELVHRYVPPTPQYVWPLLAEELGTEVWVKHENHTPAGAFKIRGGIVHLDQLVRSERRLNGVVSATRGNHGQSLAFAGRVHGVPVTIVAPDGNSVEKNAAMRGFGAELLVHGHDYQASREHAALLADERDLVMVQPFNTDLVTGVATYARELFDAAGELDRVYVPVGMGSGICGLITVRDVLGLRTEIVGVVAEGAPAYLRSFESGHVVNTESAATFVDGVATRSPDPLALELILKGAERIVAVSDDDTADAMRLLYRTTHNVAEPAGAIALAAARRDPHSTSDRIGVVLTGGNVDSDVFASVLQGVTPAV